MKSKNKLVLFVLVVIAIVIFIVLAHTAISSKALPSLGDYLASSTISTASSTPVYSVPSLSAPSSSNTRSLPITGDESLGGSLSTSSNSYIYASTTVQAPKGNIHVLVADTPPLQEQGLSDRASLPANQGMLFIFQQPSQYSFWMKDMHFPIDIVWMAADKTVVKIDKDISPATYPNLYRPPSKVLYVLEVPAGASASFGIKYGTILVF